MLSLLAAALSLPADDSFSIADVKAASTLPPAKHHKVKAPAPSAGKGKGKAEPMLVNYIMELATVRPAPEGGLGSTHVILAFIEPLTETIPGPGDDEWLSMSVLEWRDASEEERDEMRRTLGRDGKPVKIMASIGGSRARHDKSTWPEWDPVDTVWRWATVRHEDEPGEKSCNYCESRTPSRERHHPSFSVGLDSFNTW